MHPDYSYTHTQHCINEIKNDKKIVIGNSIQYKKSKSFLNQIENFDSHKRFDK